MEPLETPMWEDSFTEEPTKLRRSLLISKHTSQRASSGEAFHQDSTVLPTSHSHAPLCVPHSPVQHMSKAVLSFICSRHIKLGVSKPASCPVMLYMDAKSGFILFHFFCCDVLNLVYRQFIKLLLVDIATKADFFLGLWSTLVKKKISCRHIVCVIWSYNLAGFRM